MRLILLILFLILKLTTYAQTKIGVYGWFGITQLSFNSSAKVGLSYERNRHVFSLVRKKYTEANYEFFSVVNEPNQIKYFNSTQLEYGYAYQLYNQSLFFIPSVALGNLTGIWRTDKRQVINVPGYYFEIDKYEEISMNEWFIAPQIEFSGRKNFLGINVGCTYTITMPHPEYSTGNFFIKFIIGRLPGNAK